MYLTASKYVGGWEHTPDEERESFRQVLSAINMQESVVTEGAPALDVKINIGYWRKANAIHNWFVQNTQGGKDECQPSYVARNQLAELKDLCIKAIATKDTKELQPKQGFFFGTYEIDDYYWADLRETIDIVSKALALNDTYGFEYRASW
tara:strand:+ start:181 stop:630 length:450 start_codon:yes stop_codon:yes gene_type:complete